MAANGALIAPHVTSFGEFIMRFGGMADGNTLFAEAVDRFMGVLDRMSWWRSCSINRRALYARNTAYAHSPHCSNSVLTLTKNPKLQAKAHLDLANHYAEQGDSAQADFHFDQSEALAQASFDLGFYLGQ